MIRAVAGRYFEATGSGTHHAPRIVELLYKKEVRADPEYILREGRGINYGKTCELLKNLHEKTEK